MYNKSTKMYHRNTVTRIFTRIFTGGDKSNGHNTMRHNNTPISGTKNSNTIRNKFNKTSKDQGAIPKIPKTQLDDFLDKANSLNSQSTQ